MNELIWVGNTLYPRWAVFGFMAAVVCIVCLAFWLAYRMHSAYRRRH